MNRSTIAVIEKVDALNGTLSGLLTRNGFEVRQASDLNPFLALCKSWHPDVVILGPSGVDSGGTLDFAKQLRWIVGSTPIVLVPAESSEDLAIAALRAGINEYIKQPFHADELVGAVRRCLMPFLTINCAAIPDSLLESELFGYERGAFTGAESRKEGKLKAADGGT